MLTTLLAPPLLAAFSGGILWAILGISFLIFIHEYGHYSACRLTGTRVETFSVGFGPRLFGWERPKGGSRRFTVGRRQLDPAEHAMDFRIALIPLGGYVKMAGENPGEVRSGAPDEFGSKTIPQRLLIVSAGVIMNAVTALVFYAVCYGAGIEKDAPMVGMVPAGTPAWIAGIEPGDTVVSIDGNRLESYTDLRMEAAFLSRDDDRPIQVLREGAPVTLQARARYNEEQGLVKLGVLPGHRLRVGRGADALEIGPDTPALVDGVGVRGGLEAHARIVEALADGLESVKVTVFPAGEEQPRAVSVRIEPPAADAPKPGGWRLGIRPAGAPKVERARLRAAALKPGDVLKAALHGEQRVALADHHAFAALERSLEAVDALEVERGGELVTIPVTGARDRTGVAALLMDIVLASPEAVVAPTPAGGLSHAGGDSNAFLRQAGAPAEAVVPAGSRVLVVDGKAVKRFDEIGAHLRERDSGATLVLRIQAPGREPEDVRITPIAPELAGTVPLELTVHKVALEGGGLLGSLKAGATRFVREVSNTFRTIGGFFTGNIAFTKNIAGPITLVRASSHASEDSLFELLWFLAYVSVMLAVLNILPIPVLDGGHVVFLVAEKLRGGRPLSDRVIGLSQTVGMLLLLTLMFFALKNDLLLSFR